MGYQELISELEREADKQIATCRQEAETELARFEKETEEKLEQLRRQREGRKSAEARDAIRTILADGEKNAREIRLAAMRELADRLHRTALSLLPILRGDGYDELFESLVEELPDFSWETVLVNPGDREMARRHFPEAEVAADETICGGLEVRADQGQICIINTLEKRLERIWPELLPELIDAINRETPDAFTAN